MGMLIKKKLLSLLLLCTLFLVAACGNNEQPTQPAHATVSPPSTAQAQSTPAQVSQTPSRTGSVVITTNKSQYLTSDIIAVTITNNLSATIYASAYYTDCLPVQLQIKSTASWTALGRCPEATQSVLAIQTGSAKVFQLRPATGPMTSQPRSGAIWASGIYRVSFHYTLQPDPDTSHGGIEIVSEVFTITS